MKAVSIFVLFPESDDDFVSIGDDSSVYKEIIQKFAELKEIVSKRTSYKLFYSSTNIDNFCRKSEQICGGIYLDNPTLKMRHIVGNNSCNTDNRTIYKTDFVYYRWCLSKPNGGMGIFENSVLIKSAAQMNVESEEDVKIAIISFNINEWHRDVLPIIIDAKHIRKFPIMSNIPFFYPYSSFIEWYLDLFNNRKFSLFDVTRFERTKYIYTPTKRRIYKNIETGDYWYYDFFHKDNKEHFEVFDATGCHKGESDMNGNFDKTKKDNKKSIADIIL